MTEDKFQFEHVEGYSMKKWLLFGPEEWTKPHYKFYIYAGQKTHRFEVPVAEMMVFIEKSESNPQDIYQYDRNRWWLYKGRCFRHQAEETNPEVIKGLIIQKDVREQAKRDKAIRVARNEGH